MKLFDVSTQQWREVPEKQEMVYPEWSRDSKFIYFLQGQPSGGRGLFRIPIIGGQGELVNDLKDWHLAAANDSWMGLDPTDAPLLLRDIGSDDLYALTLEEK